MRPAHPHGPAQCRTPAGQGSPSPGVPGPWSRAPQCLRWRRQPRPCWASSSRTGTGGGGWTPATEPPAGSCRFATSAWLSACAARCSCHDGPVCLCCHHHHHHRRRHRHCHRHRHLRCRWRGRWRTHRSSQRRHLHRRHQTGGRGCVRVAATQRPEACHCPSRARSPRRSGWKAGNPPRCPRRRRWARPGAAMPRWWCGCASPRMWTAAACFGTPPC